MGKHKRLHDWLDYNRIKITCTDGDIFEGLPINVDYADETESGEDEICIETDKNNFVGIKESEIKQIDIIE